MTPTITLKEAAKELGYKQTRSLIRWAQLTGVEILSEPGCNKRFLLRAQFELGRLRKVIPLLKAKYGDKWPNALRAYTSESIIDIAQLEETATNYFKLDRDTYTPNGAYEKAFLSKLLTKNSEELT